MFMCKHTKQLTVECCSNITFFPLCHHNYEYKIVEICFYKVIARLGDEHISVEHFIVDCKIYIRINNAVCLKM